MKIIESQDFSGVDIVTIIDEENNTAQSMTKASYDEMIAQSEAKVI